MRSITSVLLLLAVSPAQSAPAPVTVTATAEEGMKRGGESYFVKGAGGETMLEPLAARGANSIRTWSTEGLANTLEEAARNALTVSAGIWLESECAWFSYAKAEDCAKQTERVRQEILRYRDHPALLAWGLGNEAEGDGTNACYWQQLERLALMAKELDPHHPTYTAVAGLSEEKARGLNEHTPHLDFVGVNTYGGLFHLREHLVKVGWTRPWMVTEWGPQGFWERPRNRSGAPLEQTSSEKAEMMQRGYDEVMAKGPPCLGSYAFVWGWKFEATATWFGLMTHEGETTAVLDVLEEEWSHHQPANRAPVIQSLVGVPDEALKPGAVFTARAEATDPEDDTLVWKWAVLPEKPAQGAGKRPNMPAEVPDVITATHDDKATLRAPEHAGLFRLYVWVSDGKGHAATANSPFEIK